MSDFTHKPLAGRRQLIKFAGATLLLSVSTVGRAATELNTGVLAVRVWPAPDYTRVDAGPVVWSDGVEDCNAIDPGVFLDPKDGRLWLTYGSYFGYIRLVELDPRTGLRRYPNRQPLNVAINGDMVLSGEGARRIASGDRVSLVPIIAGG